MMATQMRTPKTRMALTITMRRGLVRMLLMQATPPTAIRMMLTTWPTERLTRKLIKLLKRHQVQMRPMIRLRRQLTRKPSSRPPKVDDKIEEAADAKTEQQVAQSAQAIGKVTE